MSGIIASKRFIGGYACGEEDVHANDDRINYYSIFCDQTYFTIGISRSDAVFIFNRSVSGKVNIQPLIFQPDQ